MQPEFAILNHMPWWAGALILGAIIVGNLLGWYWTRDDRRDRNAA